MAKKIEELNENEVKEVKEVTPVDNNDYEEVSMEERIANIEKKANASFILNIAILVLVLITLVFSIGGGARSLEDDTTGATDTTETETYDTSAFNEIDASDIKSLSDGKTIVVWVGRQSCGYCTQYAPYIEEAAKEYGIVANYINLANYVNFNVEQPYITNAEEFDTLSGLTGKGEWETFAADNIGGTPLTLIVKNNQVIGGIPGYTDTEGVISAFKDAGLKKK